MVEVSTGIPPYGNVPHDEKLVLAICSDGLRPNVGKGTPHCYIDLVNQCLDSNPDKRPTSKEILHKIRNWRFHDDHEKPSKKLFSKKTNSISNEDIKIVKEFIDADNADVDIVIPQESFSEIRLHPGAIYSSRMMSFIDLSKSSQNKEIQRNMK
ncbi:unnamed protein product [Rhizophagus irregularis]|nr:unnamed protein product [Rhizophagus irregularis]